MLVVSQSDHRALPSLFDQVQTFLQHPIVIVRGKCTGPQRWESSFQGDDGFDSIGHEKESFPR